MTAAGSQVGACSLPAEMGEVLPTAAWLRDAQSGGRWGRRSLRCLTGQGRGRGGLLS